jgi:hypothetical protein
MATKYQELGQTGLVTFSGQIHEEFLIELRGKAGYKKYLEMSRNSPIIGALLLANELSIRKVSWEFVDSTIAEGATSPRVDLLDAARENMSTSWNDFITEALTMLPFGFSLFEICYERKDSAVLWRKFAPRGQDTIYRWNFDETGGLTGVAQQAAPTYKVIELPIDKLLLFRTRVERGNPEGRSILRTAWIPYYYAKHIMQVEAIGIERDLAGMPVITLPSGASTDENDPNSDASKAAQVVRNIRNDEQAGLVLPPGWEAELMSTGGSRQFDTDKIVRRYESRMLMSALAQFIMLGQDGVGSLALSKDMSDFFTMAVNAVADIIAETFTKYAIPRLLSLNGYDAEGVCLEHTPAGDVDVTALVDAIQKAGGNITWSAEDELWLRQLIGMPEPDVDELQASRDEKQQMDNAKNEAILKQMEQGKGEGGEEKEKDMPMKEKGMDDMTVTTFAAAAPDDAKRRKMERQLQRLIEARLEKQKRKVLKYARTLRNV